MKDIRKDLRRAASLLLAWLALPLVLTACNHGWIGDARLVNKRNNTSHYVSTIALAEKTVGTGATDPFVTGTWNSETYGGFNASKFDDDSFDLYKVSFDSDNIPEYAFGSGANSTGWELSYERTSEYTYDASDDNNTTTSIFGTLPISSMTVYQYRGKNPLVSPTSSYNTGTRMERFRFYRITGTALVVDLDQFLIAVDTYSKFVFAYGKITSVSGLGVPQAYEPIELHGNYQFYEYDPIGYVESGGTVVLYDQYKQDMRDDNAVDYAPSIHGYSAMASHSSGGEGRSPYYTGE